MHRRTLSVLVCLDGEEAECSGGGRVVCRLSARLLLSVDVR